MSEDYKHMQSDQNGISSNTDKSNKKIMRLLIFAIMVPRTIIYLIRKNYQPKYIPMKISPTNYRPKPLKVVLNYESREILLSSLR